MKKQSTLVSCLLFGGGAAFLLQLLRTLFGFEPGTGYPLRGSVLTFVTPLGLLLLCLMWAFLVYRTLPVEASPGPDFPKAFALSQKQLLPLVAGVLLMLISGAMELLHFGLLRAPVNAMTADGMMVSTVTILSPGVSPRLILIEGILTILTAISLFLAAVACRKAGKGDGEEKKVAPGLLLMAPVALVVRLVIVYRLTSIDPILAHFAVEILALAAMTLATYRLGGFACENGNSRRFALYGGWAVLLGLAAAAGGDLQEVLFYLGGALALLGFLLPRLAAFSKA